MKCFSNAALFLRKIFLRKTSVELNQDQPVQSPMAVNPCSRYGNCENTDSLPYFQGRVLGRTGPCAQQLPIGDHLEAAFANDGDGNTRPTNGAFVRKLRSCGRMFLCCIGRSNEHDNTGAMISGSSVRSECDSSQSTTRSVLPGPLHRRTSLDGNVVDHDLETSPNPSAGPDSLSKIISAIGTSAEEDVAELSLNEPETECPEPSGVEVESQLANSVSDSDSIDVTMDARLILADVAPDSQDLDLGGRGNDDNDDESVLSADAPSGSMMLNANFAEMFAILAAAQGPDADSEEGLEAIMKMVTREDVVAERK